MTSYTYAVGGFLNVESDVEVFLFDTSPGVSVPEPDILLRETDTEGDTVEWTGDGVRIALSPSLAVEKTSSAEPARFTKLLLSALQGMLLRQGATLAFGSALQTPDGGGVGLFGPSNCGKSTASFRLARQRRYRLLSDDLLICYEGRVYPFPRYVNLPRDVAVVERWLRSDAVSGERVRSWADEVDVPRAVVSERVSGGLELDDVVLVGPSGSAVERAGTPATRAVSTERARARLAALHRSALGGWTSLPAVRDAVVDGETDRRAVVREVVAGATCRRLDASGGTLAQSVASLLER